MKRSELESLNDPHKIEELRFSPFIEDNELNQAIYALLTQRYRLKPYRLQFFPLASGAIPLFRKGFFPWEALPYPLQHAQLGILLLQLEDREMHKLAHDMALFQEATLDHQKKPIYALMQQEGAASHFALEEANRNFFEAIRLTPANISHFVDHTLGMISKRTETASLLCIGSGCKSGMGAFLSQDAGVLNFGPQVLPLDDCAGFGLAGRAQKIFIQDTSNYFSLLLQSRLAFPSQRSTQFFNLQDSGYSGLWVESEISGDLNNISISVHFDGFRPLSRIAFSFFGKGEACLIAGSHKLNPRSLDRYQGPAQPLSFVGKKGRVCIEAMEGVAGMQVIPLAGDASYWGADFLVAYTLDTPTITFFLKVLNLVF